MFFQKKKKEEEERIIKNPCWRVEKNKGEKTNKT